MRRLTAIAALALLLPPAAAGKEITGAELCGADGCTDVSLPAGLHEFPGSGEGFAPPAAEPFLDVVLEFDGMHKERLWYLPAARLFAFADGTGAVTWTKASQQDLDRHLVAAAAGVETHRARVESAYVDGKRVAGDVSAYLTLFDVGTEAVSSSLGESFASVSLRTTPDSPWAHERLWLYPETSLMQRGQEFVELPRSVAADVRNARAIDAPPAGDSGFAWPLVTGSLFVALALALGAATLARRRPGFATFF
jgi:hypothetical protein